MPVIPRGNHDQNTTSLWSVRRTASRAPTCLRLGEDIKVASIQHRTSPISAAFVKRLCSAGVKKSLYGRTAILRCPVEGRAEAVVLVVVVVVLDIVRTAPNIYELPRLALILKDHREQKFGQWTICCMGSRVTSWSLKHVKHSGTFPLFKRALTCHSGSCRTTSYDDQGSIQSAQSI